AVHTPQVSVPPQPFGIVPQFLPCAAQVVGVQVVAPPSTMRTDSKVPVFLLSAIAAMTFPSPETAMASVTTKLAAPGTPASTRFRSCILLVALFQMKPTTALPVVFE